MIGGWARRAAIATIAAAAMACSSPGANPSLPTAPSVDIPASPLVGIVVGVDSPSLGKVNSFDLRLTDGSTVTLSVGVLENPTEFSPSHLAEHEATSVPVRAFYRFQEGVPVVYRLEDAST